MKTIENHFKEMTREERKSFLAKSISHEIRVWVFDEANQDYSWGQLIIEKEIRQKIKILSNMLRMDGEKYFSITTELMIFENMRC